MQGEVQTRTGHCGTHGLVEATREVPRIRFPFLYYSVVRFFAKQRPFRCPHCGQVVASV